MADIFGRGKIEENVKILDPYHEPANQQQDVFGKDTGAKTVADTLKRLYEETWDNTSKVSACFSRLREVLKRLKFPGYVFNASRTMDTVTVFVTYIEPDVFTGVDEKQQGRSWVIEYDWNDVQIIQTCLKAVLTSLEHRAREHFTYDGHAILNPHYTLEQLVAFSEGQERKEGKPIPFEVAK